MNFFQIFGEIAKVDENIYDRIDSRRACFKHLTSAGKKISMAAAPLLLGSVFNKAYAGANGVKATVMEVLAYAYRLEKLEEAFYMQGLTGGASTLSANIKNDVGLREILANETSHVAVLAGALGTLNVPMDDRYNFAKVYTQVFTNDQVFLAVAQALEDTGVRAYKGGAADLKVNPAILEVALNIHSVEARHASHVRRMRGERGWITGEQTTIPDVAIPGTTNAIPGAIFYRAGNPAASFPSEANTTQAGISGLYAGNGIPVERYSEAFDEPIDMNTVLAGTNAMPTGLVATAFLV